MEAATIILAILMFFTTVIYVYYTGQLLKETITLRKIESSPFVGVNFQIKEGFSFIIIKNIGKAPAYNLNISLEKDAFEDIKIEEAKTNCTQINYFGVNQELSIPFQTIKFANLEKTIAVDLKYQSKDKDNFNEVVILGLKSYAKLNIVHPSSEYKDILKDIQKELQEIAKVIKVAK